MNLTSRPSTFHSGGYATLALKRTGSHEPHKEPPRIDCYGNQLDMWEYMEVMPV